ncbi:Dirigent protein - like 10 [Theobroma cacao]|nr:Dirigent protein - like 10 [Theobroma cacao]
MAATRLTSTLVLCLLLLLSSSTATHRRKIRSRRPCKQMVFYFHDILYNGKNAKNATSAIVGAPAWGNRTILAGQNHFGNLVVFDDPITLDNNPHSTRDFRLCSTPLSTDHRGRITFAGPDPLNKTRDISVIGGTGDFFMARGIATLMTDAVEGEVYFRLHVDIKRSLVLGFWKLTSSLTSLAKAHGYWSNDLIETRILDPKITAGFVLALLSWDDFYYLSIYLWTPSFLRRKREPEVEVQKQGAAERV